MLSEEVCADKDTDHQGVEHIWLRFAHEVNYYQEDGTYQVSFFLSSLRPLELQKGALTRHRQGDVNDFKEGWDVVAKAVRRIAPGVRMWYTPNIKGKSIHSGALEVCSIARTRSDSGARRP